jgi:hypothetical protein
MCVIHRGQGERLVPPHTRGSVSLSLSQVRDRAPKAYGEGIVSVDELHMPSLHDVQVFGEGVRGGGGALVASPLSTRTY